jgi:hypothetical protein
MGWCLVHHSCPHVHLLSHILYTPVVPVSGGARRLAPWGTAGRPVWCLARALVLADIRGVPSGLICQQGGAGPLCSLRSRAAIFFWWSPEPFGRESELGETGLDINRNAAALLIPAFAWKGTQGRRKGSWVQNV